MNFFQFNNVVFGKATKRVGFIPARCSNKDPFCNGGVCYSNELIDLFSPSFYVMIAVSLLLLGVVTKLLYAQKLLPTCCMKCCPDYFCQCICFWRKSVPYTELSPDE